MTAHSAEMPPALRAVRGVVVGVATVLLLVGLAILPFLNPVWLGAEQSRAGADTLTGWSDAEVARVTGGLLHDLVLGPPDFATLAPDGSPAFDERERSHMRDVRAVFSAVLGASLAGLLIVLVAAATLRRSEPRGFWAPVGRAGGIVALIVVALGLLFGIAFDAAFDLFHRLFFPAGSYAFDPATSRLVQLLPEQLWYETSLAFGAVLILLGSATWACGRRAAQRVGTGRRAGR